MMMSSFEAGNALVIKVDEERIDASVAVRFKDRVKDLAGLRPRRVVLDLSTVSFVDSSGLGAIVGSMKALGRGRQLDLAGLSPAVEKVFQMTRMNSVFQIYDSVDAAVEATANAS